MTRQLPGWVRLVRAPNPGPMTLDGTNSWVLRATDGQPAVVVDPGPNDPGHLQRIAASGPVSVIVLTHRHPDHAEGAARLGELTGAPVLARDPAYGAALPVDGSVLPGGPPEVRVLDTPGHSGDSVCLLVGGDLPALLTGDTVLGRGTTVVAHPDGQLGDYLGTLHRLRALVTERGVALLLPGHGPVLGDPAAVLDGYLAHRRERLAAIEQALATGATDPEEIVTRVYGPLPAGVRGAALLSVRAQLAYLHTPPASRLGRW